MKKRWLAFVLTIVMLSSNLAPAWNAIAQAEEIAAVISSEPVISDASAVSDADASSGDNTVFANTPVIVSEPVTVVSTEAPAGEPAPISEAPAATEAPTAEPTAVPTPVPTAAPTEAPTAVPTAIPAATEVPVNDPAPVAEATATPTAAPAEIPEATETPVTEPTATPEATELPVADPSEEPEVTMAPTAAPTEIPESTEAPAAEPSEIPEVTVAPGTEPTEIPESTEAPSVEPSETPEVTVAPTEAPTEIPEVTVAPTDEPAATPEATEAPTVEPIESPETSEAPTLETTATPEATEAPTVEPSATPEVTPEPTITPVPDPLAVTISASPSYMTKGDGNIYATAAIGGGLADYAVVLRLYSPYSLEGEKIVTLSTPGTVSLNCTPTYGGTYTAEVIVTDASGQTAEASATVVVSEGFPESPANWESSVSNVALTGDWPTDILAIARSQIGNREYENCFIVDASGDRHYYTRYGHWFGAPYQDWCAMFVAFCLHYADIATEDYPVDAGCSTWMTKLQAIGAYEKIDNAENARMAENGEPVTIDEDAYLPTGGDLIFINHEGEPNPQHVGLVEYVEDGMVYTIEGNACNSVMRREYELTDVTIVGYGNTGLLAERAKEKEAAESDDPDHPETPSEQIPMAEGTIGYTTLKKVNMRSHTDTKSKLLRTIIEPGTAVSVLFAVDVGNTRWYFVEYDGTNGYIRGDLVRIEETSAPEATEETAPEATPEATETVDPEVTPEAAVEPTPAPTYYCGNEEHDYTEDCLIAPEATSTPTAEPTEEPAPTYYCGSEEHVHNETCFAEDGSLICELPEHAHTEDCLIAPEATAAPTAEPTEEPAPTYYCGDEEHDHTEECLIAPEATSAPTVEPTEEPAPTYYCGDEEHAHTDACLLPPPITLNLMLDQTSVFAGEHPVMLHAQVEGGIAPYAVEFSYRASGEVETIFNGMTLQLYSRSQSAEPGTETSELSQPGTADFEYQPEAVGTHTLAITVTDAAGTQAQAVTSLAVAERSQHETQEDFSVSIESAQLTGDVRADIAAIAATQLGYAESTTDYIVEDRAVHGYTRYGAWAQQPYMDWNVPFALFVLHYAGVDYNVTASPAVLADELRALSQYREADAYVPLQGDLVFFDWEEDGVIDHTGIVADAYVDENGYTIKTIEGDVDGVVITRMFVVDATPSIAGYGQIAENATMAQIDALSADLDALPTADEVEAQMELFYEADDADGEAAYLAPIVENCVDLYNRYNQLGPALQPYVQNIDKLMDLEWLWSRATLEEPVVESATYYCGFETEHTHSENCYDTDGNTVCGYSEHTHDESCLEQVHEEESISGVYHHSTQYHFYQNSAQTEQTSSISTYVLVPFDDTDVEWTPSTYNWSAKTNANYLVAYCADRYSKTEPGSGYDSYTIDNSRFSTPEQQRKLAGIIAHAYPFLTYAEMRAELMAAYENGEISVDVSGCSESEYIAAVQVAIWQLTAPGSNYTSFATHGFVDNTPDLTLNPLSDKGHASANAKTHCIAIKEWLLQQEVPANLKVETYTYEAVMNEYGLYTLTVEAFFNRKIISGEIVEMQLNAQNHASESITLAAGTESFSITMSDLTEDELVSALISLDISGKRMQAYFYDASYKQDMIGGQWESYQNDLSFQVTTDSTEVCVTKHWTEANPDVEKVEVNLFANGEKVRETAYLSAENNWTYTWDPLSKYDVLGNAIEYTVQETPVSGYYSTVERVTVGNTTIPVWEEVEQFEDGEQYMLISPSGALGYSGNSNYMAWVAGHPEDVSLCSNAIVWTAEEAESGSGFYLTNKQLGYPIRYSTSNGNYIIISLNKSSSKSQMPFVMDDGYLTTQYGDRTGLDLIFVYNDGTAYTDSGRRGALALQFTLYKLVQKEIPPAEINYILTNTKIREDIELIDVTVTKQWAGRTDGVYPEGITVQLLQNNRPYGALENLPNEAGEWSFIWPSLPKTDNDGNPFTYTVAETPITHYTSMQEGMLNEETGEYQITLTNTWTPNIDIRLRKADADFGTSLSGAQFDLYQQSKNEMGSPIPQTDQVLGFKLNENALVTDENGMATLPGLAVGETYYLVETRAPAGYNLLQEAIGFTISKRGELVTITLLGDDPAYVDAGYASNYQPEEGTDPSTLTYATVHVKNKAGFILPETGGTGTLPYTAGGLLIIATASLLLYIQFKRRREGTTA